MACRGRLRDTTVLTMTAVQSERHVRNRILLAVSGLGARLFRNVTAQGWAGKSVKNGRYTVIEDAYPLHAGLCVGSPDLVGWVPVTITPEMVGQTVAVFCGLEIKTGRQKARPEQQAFLDAVRAAGGIAAVVYGTADAVEAVKKGLVASAIHAPEPVQPEPQTPSLPSSH
jgi:hypothetical protein